MVRYKWGGFEGSSVVVMVEVVRACLVKLVQRLEKKLEGSSR
jgi:hypothetical protein